MYQPYGEQQAAMYVGEMQRTLHEAMETQSERLLEYGALGSMNVPVFYAPNNHPNITTTMSPSANTDTD